MFKYLLLALLLIWFFYSPALRGKHQPSNDAAKKPASPPPAPPQAENMVQCAHCGLHLPEGESIKDAQGHTYCGKAHLQAGPAGH